MDGRRRSSNSSLWVFGYGSLCWQPGFDYDDSVTGFIRGFSRKFWQGNTTHRGVEGKPGRVATLIEEKEAVVWGRAFQLSGESALPYLNNRECVLGGYLTKIATFYPHQDNHDPLEPFAALVYVAVPGNSLWLGDAPLAEIASQIVSSRGASGHNVEYLLRLADFMRESVPDAEDPHLFTLEFLVRTRIKENNMCMKTMMGEAVTPPKSPEREVVPEDEAGPPAIRVDTFEFTSRVPPKKLRCLNI